MAFSQTDLDNIDAAMVTAAVDGIASVTVAGQSVTSRSLDELRRLRSMVAAEVSADNSDATGFRLKVLKPGGCG